MRRLFSAGICSVVLMGLSACATFDPPRAELTKPSTPTLSPTTKAVTLRYQAEEFTKMNGNLQSQMKAVAAYFLAAELGDADSQLEIAQRHETGQGLEYNQELAALWYKRASELENPIAQRTLAVMHINGQAVEKDDNRAIDLFRQSAEQNDAASQYYLGRMYYRGRGVPKDLDTAINWVRKSAEQGYNLAVLNLDRMVRKRNKVKGTTPSIFSRGSVCLSFALDDKPESCRVN